ncbi:MAG: glycoside hydrolase family 25 protein [Clostridium sp.]|nr:glycoside hydrolase family 25 protein [Clostridium sp.]
MRLPDDSKESSKMTPAMVSATMAVTLFVGAILLAVLLLNGGIGGGNSREGADRAGSAQSGEETQSETFDWEKLGKDAALTPDSLDFWDLYPEETQSQAEEPKPDPVKETAATDPATDGKHTLIRYADGKEEWVLISPYLPKQGYDFTNLVSQSGLMKYYVNGKKASYLGADISKYQDYVDFVKLKKAGVDYVMLRVGARGYGSGQLTVDDYFADNIKRAADAGLEIGVYFFSQALTQEEALEEADLVLEQIRDHEVRFPVVFDMEYVENDTARVEALSKEEKTTLTKLFLDTVKAAGYIPMIYGNKEWLIKRIDLSRLTAYDVWLSQAADIPDYPYRFTMWQYTTSASISGIAGLANLNISFVDYSEK